jgi:hypothetical protein
VRGQRHAPAALYSQERPGTHCTGGWIGPRAGLNRCGKSRSPLGFDPRTVQLRWMNRAVLSGDDCKCTGMLEIVGSSCVVAAGGKYSENAIMTDLTQFVVFFFLRILFIRCHVWTYFFEQSNWSIYLIGRDGGKEMAYCIWRTCACAVTSGELVIRQKKSETRNRLHLKKTHWLLEHLLLRR